MSNDEKIKIGLIAAGVAVGIFVIYKIGQKIGIFESRASINQENNLSNYWLTPKPFNNYKKKTGFKIQKEIENGVIDNLVSRIKEAKGIFNDDEDAIYNLFRGMQSKMQCSAIAYYFERRYSENLSGFLATFLNSAEIEKIVEIIKTKPENIKGFYQP